MTEHNLPDAFPNECLTSLIGMIMTKSYNTRTLVECIYTLVGYGLNQVLPKEATMLASAPLTTENVAAALGGFKLPDWVKKLILDAVQKLLDNA
jgi:hypothetical protein